MKFLSFRALDVAKFNNFKLFNFIILKHLNKIKTNNQKVKEKKNRKLTILDNFKDHSGSLVLFQVKKGTAIL